MASYSSKNIYGSLLNYGSNNLYGTDLGNEDPINSLEKMNQIDASREDKRANLETKKMRFHPSNLPDGDTIYLDNTGYRLSNGDPFTTVNTWETSHGDFKTPELMDRQRIAYSRLTGKSLNDITDAEIFHQGELTKEKAIASLMEGQSFTSEFGPTLPEVNVISDGSKGVYGRTLANLQNPVTGKDLVNLLNNPEDNADYYSKYNSSENTVKAIMDMRDDTYTGSDAVGDLSAAAINAGISGTVGAATDTATILAGGASSFYNIYEAILPEGKIKTGVGKIRDFTNYVFDKAVQASNGVDTVKEIVKETLGSGDRAKQAKNIAREEAYQQFLTNQNQPEENDPLWTHFQKTTENVVREGISALETGVANPVAVLDSTVESMGSWISVAGIARAFSKNAVAKELKKGGKKSLDDLTPDSSPDDFARAHKDVRDLAKIGKDAGIDGALAAIAITEGASNGSQAAKEIMGTSVETLMQDSPVMRELVNNGMSPEDARRKLASDSSVVIAGKVALMAGTISKFVGTDKLESFLFAPESFIHKKYFGSAITNTAAKAGVNALKETTEELGQSGGGQLLSNIGKNDVLGTDNPVMEGVGFQAAMGGLQGGLSGGGLTAIQSIPGVVAETASDLKEPVNDAVKAGASVAVKAYDKIADTIAPSEVRVTVREFSKTGDHTKVLADIQNPEVSTDEVLGHLLDHPPESTDPTHKKKYDELIRVSVAHMVADVNNDKDNDVYKNIEAGIAYLQNREARTDVQAEIDSVTEGKGIDDVVLGTILNKGTDEQLETLKTKLEKSSPDQAEQVARRIETNRIISKNAGEVSADIRSGNVSNGKLGYEDYRTLVHNSVADNDITTAQSILRDFGRFNSLIQNKVKDYQEAHRLLSEGKVDEANKHLSDIGYRDTNGKLLNYTVAGKLEGVIQKIQSDATALSAVFNESKALVESKSGTVEDTTNAEPSNRGNADTGVSSASKPVPSAESRPAKKKTANSSAKPLSALEKGENEQNAQIKKAKSVEDLEKLVAETEEVIRTGKNRNYKPASMKILERKLELTKEALKAKKAEQPVQEKTKLTRNDAINAMGMGVEPAKEASSHVKRLYGVMGKLSNAGLSKAYKAYKAYMDANTGVGRTEESLHNEASKAAMEALGLNKKNAVTRTLENVKSTYDGMTTAIFKKASPKSFLLRNNMTIADYRNSEKENATNQIKEFVKYVGSKLDEQIAHVAKYDNSNSKFKDLDLSILLRDGKNMDQSIKDTMVLNALKWIIENGRGTLSKDARGIAGILGIQEEQVNGVHWRWINGLGDVRSGVAQSIGMAVLRDLDLTTNTDVDMLVEPKLAMSIGLNLLHALHKAGYVEFNDLGGLHADELMGNTDPNGESLEQYKFQGKNKVAFVAITTNEAQDAPLDALEKLFENNREISEVIEDISGDIASSNRSYMLGKLNRKSLGTKMVGTVQDIPKKLYRTMVNYSNQPNYVDTQVLDALNNIGESTLMEVLGYESVEGVNKSREKNVNSENNRIKLSIIKMRELLTDLRNQPNGLDTAIHFPNEIWKQGRMGMSSTNFNIQSDKLHRALVNAGYTQTVNKNDTRTMKFFVRALLQGFDTKVDNMSPRYEEMPSSLEEVLKPEEIAVYEAGARALLEKPKTAEEKKAQAEAVVKAVKLGDEGMHTFTALVAYGQYLNADTDGNFTTSLSYEIDGKTNGPMIALTLLAGAEDPETVKKLLGAGGMYEEGSMEHFSDFYKQYGLDLYTILGKAWNRRVNENLNSLSAKQRMALAWMTDVIHDTDTGKNADLGRSLAKPATMTIVFGSSIENTSEAFSQEIVDKIIKAIEATKGDVNKLKQINTMFIESFGINMGLTSKNYLEPINKYNVSAIKSVIAKYYGGALESAVEEVFGEFINNRNILNTMANEAFKMFNAKYENTVEAYKRDNNVKTISKEVQQTIYEQLLESTPLIKTFLSTGLKDSIVAYKEENEASSDSKDREARVSGNISSNHREGENVVTDSAKTMSGNATIKRRVEPGVAAVIQMIHSLDSAMMESALNDLLKAGVPVLNIFDAVTVPFNQIEAATDALNTGFETVIKGYDMSGSFLEMFNRVRGSMSPTDMIRYYESIPKKGIPHPASRKDDRQYFDSFAQFESYVKEDIDLIQKITANNIGRIKHFRQYVGVPTQPVLEDTITPEKAVKDLFDSLGSNEEGINVDNYQYDVGVTLTENNVGAIFDEFGTDTAISSSIGVKDSAGHIRHLGKVINTLVTSGISEIGGIVLRTKKTGGKSVGAQVGNKVLLDVGLSPATRGTDLSAREAYVHELVHAVTRKGLKEDYQLRKQVYRLRDAVLKHLEGMPDMLDAFLTKDNNGNVIIPPGSTLQDERNAAQRRFEYIFGIDPSTRQSKTIKAHITQKEVEVHVNNSLYEFVAYGLTNENFMEILRDPSINIKEDVIKNIPGTGIFGKILTVFNKLISLVMDRFTNRNKDVYSQLEDLAQDLVNANNKAKASIFNSRKKEQKLDKAIRGVTRAVGGSMYKLTDGLLGIADKSNKIKAIRNLLRHVKEREFTILMKAVRDVSRNLGITDRSFLAELAREGITYRTEGNTYLHKLLSAYKDGVDQARADKTAIVMAMIQESFGKNELSREDKKALTKVILRGDLVSLVGNNNESEIMDYLRDNSFVTTRIQQIYDDLKTLAPNSDVLAHHKEMAKSLANRMIIGKGIYTFDYMNAYSIVNHHSLDKSGDLILMEKLVDQLASLEAILLMKQADRNTVVNIMEKEFAKPADQLLHGKNGIQTIFNLAKDNKNQALTDLFSGQKGLMIKGYIKEVSDPSKAFEVVGIEGIAELEKQGFKPVPKEKGGMFKDLNGEMKFIYTTDSNFLTRRISTIISVMNDRAKGAEVENYYDHIKDVDFKNWRTTLDKKVAPLRNANGKIVGLRYMMGHDLHEELVDQNLSIDELIAGAAADIKVKPRAKAINRRAVKEIHESFLKDYDKDPKGYVRIGPNSTDNEIAQIWNMLPDDTKETIRSVTGRDAIYVPEKELRMIFGYRKFSISTWHKNFSDLDRANAGAVKQLIIGLADALGHRHVRYAENVWQSIVSTVKDTIVIKSVQVMVNNIVSNNILLYTLGLSIPEIIKYQREAITSFLDYQKNHKELESLELQQRVNPNNANTVKIKRDISILKDKLSHNPVKELIDAGVFQTIIEDIDTTEHDYSYRSKLEKLVEPVTDKIPEQVKKVGEYALIGHNTTLYKELRNFTQMSDFVARYALHKHYMSYTRNGKNKYTVEQSIQKIKDVFIDYDVPTSPTLQYLNDMGLLMFTKYWLRVQKVFLKAAINMPGRTLQTILGNEFFGHLSSVYQSSILFGSLPSEFTPDEILDAGAIIPLAEAVDYVI